MLRSAIVFTSLLSTPALAGTAYDRWGGSIDEVTLEGLVEVPLYSSATGGVHPNVQVMIGENSYLFAVVPGISTIYVSEYVTEREELKVRHSNQKIVNIHGEKAKWAVGGEFQWSNIDELHIGEMVLRDLTVLTKDPFQNDDAFYKKNRSGVSIQGFIGLGALPSNIAWAIQPSTGTISFATGEAAATLLNRDDGAEVSYKKQDSYQFQWAANKAIVPGATMIVEAVIGGETVETRIGHLWGNSIDAKQGATGTAQLERADQSATYMNLSVGNVPLASRWVAVTDNYEFIPDLEGVAEISVSAFSDVDIFVNPQAQTMRLVPTKGQTRHDPLPFLIADAEKQVAPSEDDEEEGADAEALTAGGPLDKPVDVSVPMTAGESTDGSVFDTNQEDENEDEDENKDEDEDEDKPPGKTGDWHRLAKLYASAGQTDDELRAYETEVALSNSTCPAYLRLGQAQLRAGQIADAIVNLENASEHYHNWYDISLDERTNLEKAFKKAKGEDKPNLVAASSCHVSDTYLAAAMLAAGDYETVERLYNERFDLDAGLALIAANALFAQGQHQTAHAPLRQAVKLDSGPWSEVRLGLAMVYQKAGDWATAEEHYKRALNHPNMRGLEMWLDGLRTAKGADAALTAAMAYSASRPNSPAAFYALAREAKRSENKEAIAAATSMADAFFDSELDRSPRSGDIWGTYARYLLLTDRFATAKEAAELAVQFDPNSAAAWMALSDIHTKDGDTDRARQFKLRAAQSAPFHPGYAIMMGEF
jgi:Tfp pilus assembly protein PilF